MAEHLSDLDNALQIASGDQERQRAYQDGLARAKTFTVETIVASYYRPLLSQVVSEVPCTA